GATNSCQQSNLRWTQHGPRRHSDIAGLNVIADATNKISRAHRTVRGDTLATAVCPFQGQHSIGKRWQWRTGIHAYCLPCLQPKTLAGTGRHDPADRTGALSLDAFFHRWCTSGLCAPDVDSTHGVAIDDRLRKAWQWLISLNFLGAHKPQGMSNRRTDRFRLDGRIHYQCQLLLHRSHNLQALLCLIISNNLLQLRIQRRTIYFRTQTKVHIRRDIPTRITQIMTRALVHDN